MVPLNVNSFLVTTKGVKNPKGLQGKGSVGSLFGSSAGSISGTYIGELASLTTGSQLGLNLGDLLPFYNFESIIYSSF